MLCDLTGVVARSETTGLSIVVPAPGYGVGANALRIGGEAQFSLTVESDGKLVVDELIADFSAHPQPAGPISEGQVGGQSACTDYSYTNLYGKESDNRVWYYNNSRVRGGAGSSAASYYQQQIISGVVDLLAGYNDCGLPRNFAASQTYNGTTSMSGSAVGNGTCSGSDGYNIVDWGSIETSTTLAVACTYNINYLIGKEITGGDIKIDPEWSWLTGAVPSTCTSSYSLLAVMTHEWGHTFGLGHTPEPNVDHRQQTIVHSSLPARHSRRLLDEVTGLECLTHTVFARRLLRHGSRDRTSSGHSLLRRRMCVSTLSWPGLMPPSSARAFPQPVGHPIAERG